MLFQFLWSFMLSRKKKRKREKIRKVSRQMTCFVVDDIDNLQAIWNFKGPFTIIPENESPFWVSFSVLRFFFSVFRVFEIVCFISFQETGMKKIEKKKLKTIFWSFWNGMIWGFSWKLVLETGCQTWLYMNFHFLRVWEQKKVSGNDTKCNPSILFLNLIYVLCTCSFAFRVWICFL